MNCQTMIVGLAFVASTAFSSPPFDDGFAKPDMSAYLDNAAELNQDAAFTSAEGMKGKRALRLTFDNETAAAFKMAPVTAGRPCGFRFRGRWDNDETLESNPTFDAVFYANLNFATIIPSYEISFYDTDKKLIGRSVTGAMPYGQWREYREVFFPPPGAAYARLSVKAGTNTGAFLLDDIRFDAGGGPGTVELNFSEPGDYDGSLFGLKVRSSRRVCPDGTVVFTSFPAFSPAAIPMAPGKYRLELRTKTVPATQQNFIVDFLDDKGKKVRRRQVGGQMEVSN